MGRWHTETNAFRSDDDVSSFRLNIAAPSSSNAWEARSRMLLDIGTTATSGRIFRRARNVLFRVRIRYDLSTASTISPDHEFSDLRGVLADAVEATCLVAKVMVPPSSTAVRALSPRLSTALRSSEGYPRVDGFGPCKSNVTWTRLVGPLRSATGASRRSACRSTTFEPYRPLREHACGCAVRSRTRCVARGAAPWAFGES